MADLDSFFAKKDKKKVKGKKFTTTDEIAKRLEDCEEKMKVKPKIEPIKKQDDGDSKGDQDEDANKSTIGKSDSGPVKKEEEEWNDFVDESDRDLTDLKITKLNIEDDEDGNQGNTEDDPDKGEEGTRKGGVWQTAQQTAPAPPVEEIVAAPAVVEEKKPAVEEKKGGYVPPHLRNMQPSLLPRGNTPQRRNRQAPDINNEMAFPSLSDAGAANPMGAWGRRQNTQGFESVKQGASARSSQDAYEQPKLSTANRFDCLTDNS